MRVLLLVITTVVVGVVAGRLTPTDARRGDPSVVEVSIVRRDDPGREFAFEPAVIAITAGTTVRWVNPEDVFHTVTTADLLAQLVPNRLIEGRLFRAGQSVEFIFNEPGEFAYYCQPHADFMTGIVRVLQAGIGPATSSGAP